MEFSKKEIITSAWNILKPNLGLMVLVIVFIFSLNLILGIVQDRLLQDVTLQSILFTVAAYLFQMGLNLGMLRICLNLIYNKGGDFSQLFGSFHLLIPYLFASLITVDTAAFRCTRDNTFTIFNFIRFRYVASRRNMGGRINDNSCTYYNYTLGISFFTTTILRLFFGR